MAPELLARIWKFARFPLFAYLLLMALIFFMQSRMLYFPYKEHALDPTRAGMSFEDLMLKTADGVRVSAWFVPVRKGERASAAVIVCHGNAGNISHRLDTIQIFNRLGLDVLIFDYRGYGKSEGSPDEKGTYEDARAAWRFLREKGYGSEKIVVFGRSLGGAIASRLAREVGPAALIVESSFTSVPDLASEIYWYFPVRLLSRFEYPTAKNLSIVKAPVLVIHSREDNLIPFAHGERNFASAKEPKTFLPIRGDHNEGFFVSKNYVPGLRKFLRDLGLI